MKNKNDNDALKKTKFICRRSVQWYAIKDYFDNPKKITKQKLAEKCLVKRNQLKKIINLFLASNSIEEFCKVNYRGNNRKYNLKSIAIQYVASTNIINDFRQDTSYRMTYSEFAEHLVEDLKWEPVSISTIERALTTSLIVSPRSNRETRRNNKMLIKQTLNSNLEETLIKLEDIKKINARPIYRGKSLVNFGYMVEVDACAHAWFNGETFHIYHAIDKRTNMLLAIHIEKEETTKGYMHLFWSLFTEYGVPTNIRTDKRKTFWVGDNIESSLGEIFKHLGAKLGCSSVAVFKPNVERSFNTAQQFYQRKFWQQNINTLEQAASFLPTLKNLYNTKFAKKESCDSDFLKVSKRELKDSLALTFKAKVLSGNCLSFKGEYLAPVNEKGKRVLMVQGQTIKVKKDYLDNQLFIISDGKRLSLKPIHEDQLVETIFFDEYYSIQCQKKAIEKQKEIGRKIRIAQEQKQIFLENWSNQLKERERRMIANFKV